MYWLEESFIALLSRACITLINEQYHGYEANYINAKNEFDKLINKLYSKTKNLTINNVNDIKKLLEKDNLINLAK